VEAGYYQDPKNLATVMNWIGNKLNFKEMSDWYQLSRQKLALIGGQITICIWLAHCLLSRPFSHESS